VVASLRSEDAIAVTGARGAGKSLLLRSLWERPPRGFAPVLVPPAEGGASQPIAVRILAAGRSGRVNDAAAGLSRSMRTQSLRGLRPLLLVDDLDALPHADLAELISIADGSRVEVSWVVAGAPGPALDAALARLDKSIHMIELEDNLKGATPDLAQEPISSERVGPSELIISPPDTTERRDEEPANFEPATASEPEVATASEPVVPVDAPAPLADTPGDVRIPNLHRLFASARAGARARPGACPAATPRRGACARASPRTPRPRATPPRVGSRDRRRERHLGRTLLIALAGCAAFVVLWHRGPSSPAGGRSRPSGASRSLRAASRRGARSPRRSCSRPALPIARRRGSATSRPW
jgi:hypothetical protein